MNSNNSKPAGPGFGQPLPQGTPSPNSLVKSLTYGPPAPWAPPAQGTPSERPGGKRRRRRVTKKRRNSRRRRTRRHR
jgi:hypothetical protein